jgi:outer membrane protein assembly factor BamB
VLLDDLVYVGSNDGALHFIDRRTGVQRWSYRTLRAIRATPAVAEGLVFFGGEDRWFRALDARTLGWRWTYAWRWVHTTLFVWGITGPPAPLPGLRWQYRANAPIVASAAVSHDLVYVASERGTLTALDIRTGLPRWSFAARKGISASLVVAGEVLYVASHDQTLTVLDARHGTLRWQFTAGGPIHATPVVSDGRVYVAAMDGIVYALQ